MIPQRQFQVVTFDFDPSVVINGNDLHFDDRLPSSCDFFAWIQCMRWPGPYDPQERFRGIAELPQD